MEMVLSHESWEDDVECVIGGDDDSYRHLACTYTTRAISLELLDFARYPSVLWLRDQTCYLSRLLSSVAFIAASSTALGLCPVVFLILGGGRVSSFCLLFFKIPLYTFILTETRWERHKSFVFRLSRTAVLYVIYHGGLSNGNALTENCFVLPHLFCDIPCDSSAIADDRLLLVSSSRIFAALARLQLSANMAQVHGCIGVRVGGGSGNPLPCPSCNIPASATTPASPLRPASHQCHRSNSTPDACPSPVPLFPIHTTNTLLSG